jgi:tetratricopeptide (TPR) repeat protein
MVSASRVLTYLSLLGLLACNRNPQAYLEKGNQLAADHKYRDASIQYRNAIKRNPRFGEAFYRLGLCESAQGNWPEAYRQFTRAVTLMPDNAEAKVKLADVDLMVYWADPGRPKAVYDQLITLTNELLAKDANSFDGLRIKGSLAMIDRQPNQAIEYFSKANHIKPMQPGLVSELAQALLADGQMPQAESLALQMISRDPTFKPIYDVLYAAYMKSNRPGDAEELLRRKIENNPTDSESILQLARHYRAVGKAEQMQAALQRLTGNPKSFPRGRLLAGEFFGQIGDWGKAQQQFEAGAHENPADKLTYEKADMNALLAQGRLEEAGRRLGLLAKQYPTDLEIKAVQASAWLLSGQPTQVLAAVATLQDLTKQKPNDVNLRLGLAQAYRAAKDWDSARAQFQEVLKTNRGRLEARLGLAELGLIQNKPSETLRYASEILAADADNRRARLLRAEALASTGSYKEAHQELNTILRRFPGNRDVQIQLGALAIREKRFKDAEKIFGKLRQTGSQDARSMAGLADAYVAEKQYARAIQLLNDELKGSRNPALLRSVLAYAATRAGRYDLALEQYGKMLVIEPRSPELYVRMAEVHQLKGDRDGMVTDMEKAKQLSPKDARPAVALGSLLQQAGHLPEAKANYERALELQPDNIVALNNLAYLLAETGGDLNRALELARRVQRKQPGVPALTDTLGWIYLKMNLQDSAIQIFRADVIKQPDNPTFRYHLGVALWRKGDKEKARTELQTALAKGPAKDEEAQIRQILSSGESKN